MTFQELNIKHVLYKRYPFQRECSCKQTTIILSLPQWIANANSFIKMKKNNLFDVSEG